MTNLWTDNGNHVAAHSPAPGDLAVMTLVKGLRIAVQPIADYSLALAKAQALAAQVAYPVRVLCLTSDELLTMTGTTPEAFAASMSPAVADELLQLAKDACLGALTECNDPAVRATAMDILTGMGAVQ